MSMKGIKKGFGTSFNKRTRSKPENGFRSKFENSINKSIPNTLKEYISYESEKIDYIIESKYTPDFIIYNEYTGKKIYIEAKGYLDVNDRRKILAVIKSNPTMDLRIVFQNKNNKLNKKSKMTYEEWAVKYGIKYCEQKIPLEWIEEVFSNGN